MSTTTHKGVMQHVFAELGKGNLAPFVEAMAEEMTWTWMGRGPLARTFEGKAAVVGQLLASVEAALAGPFVVDAHHFVADGDVVVVEHTGRNTTVDGRPYRNRYCWVCRLSEGKLVEIREYMDTALVAETFGSGAEQG